MQKIQCFVFVGMLMIVCVLCGCQENKQPSPITPTNNSNFIALLNSTSENLSSILANMHYNFNNFYNYFDWATNFYSLTYIPGTTLKNMQGYAPQMTIDYNSFKNNSTNYIAAKFNEDLTKLNSTQRDLVWIIDYMINDFNNETANISAGIADMNKYYAFVSNVATDLQLTANLSTTMTLMNSKVNAQMYDDALALTDELINITKESKIVHNARANMSIVNYSMELMSSYDTLIQSWQLYKEYLTLFIAGDQSAATQKYSEYNQKYSQALSEGLSQSITDINNQIDAWCQKHLGSVSTMFEIYDTPV